MSTKIPVQFKGMLKWAVVPPGSQPQNILDPKPGQEENSNYSIEVECSQAEYKDLIKQGVSRMTVLREDENTGKTFIKIKCPKVNGKFVGRDPVVLDTNGAPITVMIANGSTGIVSANIESFESKGGIKVVALRFHSVLVTNLIEFIRNEPVVDANPNEAAEASLQDSDITW